MTNFVSKLQAYPRSGCKDVWNAFMCKDADFSRSQFDIPMCPTTATTTPNRIITWSKAQELYKTAHKRTSFSYPAFVCFYMDDYKFDGPKEGIWSHSSRALKILKHFDGVITPDFSTCQDFPESLKIYNTYRMCTFGYWLGKNGISVINNVRWGTIESYRYCWDGIPKNSIVSIGTVGGSPRKIVDRTRFIDGLTELVSVLKPHTILVYGSANYECFQLLKAKKIDVISYESETAEAFRAKGGLA